VLLSDNFTVDGEVNSISASIAGDLDCSAGVFAPGSSLVAERATIGGIFWWTGIKAARRDADHPKLAQNAQGLPVTLDLLGASVASIVDDKDSWPEEGNLTIDGFTYNALVNGPGDAETRLLWLHRQDRGTDGTDVPTQPYEQLAKVLRGAGDEQGARKVLIAMEDDLLAYGKLSWPSRVEREILKYTVAYGYRPWYALPWSFGLILFGYLLFGLGYQSGVIAPTDKKTYDEAPSSYQRFNAFVYSLDTFLPIINLGLKDKWMPNSDLEWAPTNQTWLAGKLCSTFPNLANKWPFNSGSTLRVYRWFHLGLGWILSTLAIAGLTGLIRTQ
jgi:hypothetical protein